MKKYIHPEDLKVLEHVRQVIRPFIANCPQLEVASAHFRPEHTVCDVSSMENPEVVYVLRNHKKQTIRVAEQYLSVVANVIDIIGAEIWFEKVKVWRKEYEEEQKQIKLLQEQKRKENSKKVITRKSPVVR